MGVEIGGYEMEKTLKTLIMLVLTFIGAFLLVTLFTSIFKSLTLFKVEPKVPLLIAEQEDEKDQREISANLDKYPEAMRLLSEGDYFKSMEIFRSLANYKDGRMNYHIALRNIRKFSTKSGYHTLGINSECSTSK